MNRPLVRIFPGFFPDVLLFSAINSGHPGCACSSSAAAVKAALLLPALSLPLVCSVVDSN